MVIPCFNRAGKICAKFNENKDEEKGISTLTTSSNGSALQNGGKFESEVNEVKIDIDDDDDGAAAVAAGGEETFFNGKSDPINIPSKSPRVRV